MITTTDHDRLGGCYCDEPLCYGARTARALSCVDMRVDQHEGRRVLTMTQRTTGLVFQRFFPAHITGKED